MCLPIIGAVVSGIGAAMGAMNAAAQDKANAALERRNAEIERETGSFEGARKADEVKRVLGSARAGTAANGIAMSGSAFDVIDESAQEGALDVAAIRWNSRLKQDNSLYRAKIHDMNAKANKMAAPIAFISPVIEGVAKYQSSFATAA